LSLVPVDATEITVSVVSINSFAVSSPSPDVLVALPCQPPTEVSVVQNPNGADVSFVSTPPCSHVLRLWAITSHLGVSLLRELRDADSPVLLRLLPRGVGFAVTLSSIDSRGVEGLPSPPALFVLPPDQPLGVRVDALSQGQVYVAWSLPVLPVVESLPYSGYAATPLTDIAAAFVASSFGGVADSQRVEVSSLEAGLVVHSVNASLSVLSVLLSSPLRNSPIIYVARRSFGVRSDWLPVFRDAASASTNVSAGASSIEQAWCELKADGATAGVGGVFISSSGDDSVLVAVTRCGVGSRANVSIENVDDSAFSETILMGDDGMGHASAVVSVQSWPHPKFAAGRIVTVLAPNQLRSSCKLSGVGSLPTSPVVFECSPCTTLAVPGDSIGSIGQRYGVHWTVLLALNSMLQPSHDIRAKAVRVAHQ
jgi:hypothetical protein